MPVALTVIDCSASVALSRAETLTMPLASMSKETSISGWPFGAGGTFESTNSPSRWFSAALSLSPWSTRILTAVWLSRVVVKMCDFCTGAVVLRSIRVAKWPSKVAMPSESGVTSSSSRSRSPETSMLPWIAAPTATTSSGFTPRCSALAEELRHGRLHHRRAGLAADEHDVVDVLRP